jgi:hypothetical protein
VYRKYPYDAAGEIVAVAEPTPNTALPCANVLPDHVPGQNCNVLVVPVPNVAVIEPCVPPAVIVIKPVLFGFTVTVPLVGAVLKVAVDVAGLGLEIVNVPVVPEPGPSVTVIVPLPVGVELKVPDMAGAVPAGIICTPLMVTDCPVRTGAAENDPDAVAGVALVVNV